MGKAALRMRDDTVTLLLQVPREGLPDAKLDRAAGQPAQRAQDPDTQPQRRHHLRVPGQYSTVQYSTVQYSTVQHSTPKSCR